MRRTARTDSETPPSPPLAATAAAAAPRVLGKGPFESKLPAAILTLAGLLVVVLIGTLDRRTESQLSFGLLYLIPVAVCAWWCGFSSGILIALAGAMAWHVVDAFEHPAQAVTIAGWNGIVRFGTFVLVSSLVSRLRIGITRERHLARTDVLTGAANGRTFYEAAAVEASRARRTFQPLTLAYFDLDDFKQLNDRFGHAAGDAALRTVVETIQRHLRRSDVLARLGGDEFALLLPGTDPDGALVALARLQSLLAHEVARRGWPLGVSVGAATFLRPPEDVDQIISRVDGLMYNAKRNGKGRIEHAVVQEGHDGPRPVERRAAARQPCNCAARIRQEGREREDFATIRDISPDGVGLHMGDRYLAGTLLIIEPLTPGPRTLLARVRQTAPKEGGWRHGCELAHRLSAEELGAWLGDPAAV